MNLYTVKSSAHRAAKQAGLTKDQYEIVEIDGKFGYRVKTEEELVEELRMAEEVEEPVEEFIEAEMEQQADEQADERLNEEAAQAIEAPAKGKAKPEVKRKSDIPRPSKTVWHIADEMVAANPNVRRKEVIEECVRRGIAYYTARTQYQQWLTAVRNSTAK
jgi:hypothetical protein